MITSEAVPFAKTGGLADVVTALSHALKHLDHDARVIMPLYGSIQLEESVTLPLEIPVSTGILNTAVQLRLYQHRMNGGSESSVEFLFVDHPYFSERDGVYGESSVEPYSDNSRRFLLFSYAVLESLQKLDWTPDILHCHDWTAGMIPLLLKQERYRGLRKTCRTVMTIHNLGYQGIFSKHDMHFSDLLAERLSTGTPSQPSDPGSINFLKTGIMHADLISTVSETYASEIQQPLFGEGLHTLLQERSSALWGITNGVDYQEWNPEDDSELPFHFSAENQQPKARLKRLLQAEMGLAAEPDTPVIGIVSRLADQKGFRELCAGKPSALERMAADLQVQFAIIGTGDREIEKSLKEQAALYGNIAVRIAFSNYLAPLVEAGSDFFLMPSRYEPCGLNQIYSLRYGTIPIVRRTGGLADTVTDFSPGFDTGTGIVFDSISGEAVYNAVRRITEYQNLPASVREAVRARCMNQRFTWDKAAVRYVEMYDTALEQEESV